MLIFYFCVLNFSIYRLIFSIKLYCHPFNAQILFFSVLLHSICQHIFAFLSFSLAPLFGFIEISIAITQFVAKGKMLTHRKNRFPPSKCIFWVSCLCNIGKWMKNRILILQLLSSSHRGHHIFNRISLEYASH